jgi:hypothetical protein
VLQILVLQAAAGCRVLVADADEYPAGQPGLLVGRRQGLGSTPGFAGDQNDETEAFLANLTQFHR